MNKPLIPVTRTLALSMSALLIVCIVVVGLMLVVGRVMPGGTVVVSTTTGIYLLDTFTVFRHSVIENGTFGSAVGIYEVWSPDGQRIAFVRTQDGNSNIFVADASGRNVTQLTYGIGNYYSPMWLSDGNEIAFLAGYGSDRTMYVSDVDGLYSQRIAEHVSDFGPMALSGGPYIAYVTSTNEIHIVDVERRSTRLLTAKMGSSFSPAWSPDGSQIAFTSDLDGDMEIYVVNFDGTDLRQLTDNSTQDVEPRWSPDGQQIAFERHTDIRSYSAIHLMNADGSGERQLTIDGMVGMPGWLSNGNHIIFGTWRNGAFNLSIINRDGSAQYELTWDGIIAYSPRP